MPGYGDLNAPFTSNNVADDFAEGPSSLITQTQIADSLMPPTRPLEAPSIDALDLMDQPGGLGQ